jgi:outer membrane protein OmpA-like peptidoglycan-associated protein
MAVSAAYGTEMRERYGRVVLTLALLLLLFFLSFWGLAVSTRRLQGREEARRRVTAALAERNPERAAELFRRARVFDRIYGACEAGSRLEKSGSFEEATESFRLCRDGDPDLVAAHLAWVESKLRAGGGPAVYPELRAHLRRVQEIFPGSPSADPEVLRSLEDLILDLEALIAHDAPREHPEAWTVDELVDILTRIQTRGRSRYDGPRVPLRLGFRPGGAVLGEAAEVQLRDVVRALRDGRLAKAVLQIEGHTDSFEAATEAGRAALGWRRAEAVRDFLARSGIPRQRLRTRSLADEYPLASNDTLPGRDANRRVELFNLDEGAPLWKDVRKQR